MICSALLAACANPYLEEMNWVERDYRAGRMSRDEYENRMDSLYMRSEAQEAENRRNTAIAATAIGAAALIGAAAIHAEAQEDRAHAIRESNRIQQRNYSRSYNSGRRSGGGGYPQTQQGPSSGGGSGNRPPPR